MVLAILVAIGGLVVPLLGNYLHRANIASCTVNIPEMDKWIQTYVNLYSSYPDRMDNLCLAAGGLASYVQTGAGGDYGASFTAVALTADDAAALNDAGITTLCNIVEDAGGDWNPTFWPYNNDRDTAPTTTAVAADVEVGHVDGDRHAADGAAGCDAGQRELQVRDLRREHTMHAVPQHCRRGTVPFRGHAGGGSGDVSTWRSPPCSWSPGRTPPAPGPSRWSRPSTWARSRSTISACPRPACTRRNGGAG